MINVTQPYMPPLEEFNEYLKKIWESKWLTNNGQFHQDLEKALCEYLGVKYISLFSNATLALITALQTLRITGEVITTPFSFVATTHAIWWNGIKPVFVDIEPVTMNIDPAKIEAAITPHTTAILPVHVYGNPCAIDKLQNIADTYGLKIIYDACHTFGAKLNGVSLVNHGDLSVLSFHATKVFNTFEGGAIVCHDEKTKKRIDYLKNFGFADEVTVVAPGINAKMNEIQAAFGLLNLKYVDEAIQKRQAIAKLYRDNLKSLEGIHLLNELEDMQYNYPYFPILIDSKMYGKTRDEVYDLLKENGFYARRYFYPLISEFPTYKGLPSAGADNLPVASQIAKEILCLPIYPDLDHKAVMDVCNLIKNKN
jgi:dTDP-4-amino-4,6-dideoxygalactose transaminase